MNKANGLVFELEDGQEVPAVGKLCCLVDLGPMKIVLTFYILGLQCTMYLRTPFSINS